MLSDDEFFESGSTDDEPNEVEARPTPDETRAAAEIAVFLEDDLNVDCRRLYLRVKEGTLYIQGSVETHELKKEIEALLVTRPGIKALESNLSVQASIF